MLTSSNLQFYKYNSKDSGNHYHGNVFPQKQKWIELYGAARYKTGKHGIMKDKERSLPYIMRNPTNISDGIII